MSRNVTYLNHAKGPSRSYAASATYNGLVWACGQIPVREDGSTPESMAEQVELVFNNLEEVLYDAGSSLERILKINVFLADLDEFDEFDRAYRKRLDGNVLPPRTTVEVARFRGDKRIEIDVVAAQQ